MLLNFYKTFAFKVICFITALFFCLLGGNTYAIDLDATVNDNSRSNFSSGQAKSEQNFTVIQRASDVSTKNSEENELPTLPKILQQKQTTTIPVKQYTYEKKTTTPVYTPVKTKVYRPTNIAKLRKGMTFEVVNTAKISDYQKAGTYVNFAAPKDIKTPYFTIPKGTKFSGKIVDSHRPQYTCNGGLIVISVDSITMAGKRQKFKSVITKVGDKKVFFENYKGKRTYWKTVWKKGAWGRALYSEMWRTTVNMCAKGSTAALSPFTFLYGVICWSGNTIASPVIAIFNKGGSAVIPAGTKITIKLLEDVNIMY